MTSDDLLVARKEIRKTLGPCNFCTRRIGISFIDDMSTFNQVQMNIWYIFSISTLIALLVCEIRYVLSRTSLADFIASLHIVTYGIMGAIKLLTIWYKKDVFRQLVEELAELWPVSVNDKRAAEIKHSSLSALKIVQFWYVFCNLFGNMLFNVTPIAMHVSRLVQGRPSDLGFIWMAIYPFDKTQPILHELVFAFEFFSALVSVWGMLGTDVIFTTMASHISMMLRLLQVKIRSLGTDNVAETNVNQSVVSENVVCYNKIKAVIKVHQRLIKYIADLEDVFSVVNLTNVILCAVNICFVAFNIVVTEPWMVVNNKVFLGALLTQVGIICWYADDIYRASIAVSDAVYESGWYKTDVRCQRALLLLLQRSQKPLCFTAFKFRNITMATYSSILTSAYSYFTLLYTIYSD